MINKVPHPCAEILAVKAINDALDGQDPAVTLRALQNPTAQLPLVMNNAAQLYHFEFRNIKAEKQVRHSHRILPVYKTPFLPQK